ncbi:MAG TPA: hypothetical protein VM533_03885 [Fimbriiglobus sp.]|jgi:hypothetical protein|nr:hypothetical protein [Fimbriiglobus sp.]
MERLRSLSRRAGVVAPALFAAHFAAGCSSGPPVELVTDAFNHAVALDKPEPASQIVCFWQRRLSNLPDPTRDGAPTPGIAGQMFLIAPSNAAADVNGDLAVVVYDETPRPPGQLVMKPEMWHYTKDTLRRLVTSDERFGRSIVLFLPWPAHWQGNVTAVKVLARYQSPGNPDLFAGEVRMALDFSAGGPVWSEVAKSDAGTTRKQSVPDPARMLEQAKAATATQPFPTSTTAAAQPAGSAVATPTVPTNWPPTAPVAPPPTIPAPPPVAYAAPPQTIPAVPPPVLPSVDGPPQAIIVPR